MKQHFCQSSSLIVDISRPFSLILDHGINPDNAMPDVGFLLI